MLSCLTSICKAAARIAACNADQLSSSLKRTGFRLSQYLVALYAHNGYAWPRLFFQVCLWLASEVYWKKNGQLERVGHVATTWMCDTSAICTPLGDDETEMSSMTKDYYELYHKRNGRYTFEII